MDDQLSVTASVVNILSFGLAVSQRILELYAPTRHELGDVKSLCVSATALTKTLEALRNAIGQGHDDAHGDKVARERIWACEGDLKVLDKKLDKVRRLSTDPTTLNLDLSLRYAFRQKTVEKLKAIIDNELLDCLKLALVALNLETSIAIHGIIAEAQLTTTSSINVLRQGGQYHHSQSISEGSGEIAKILDALRAEEQREKIIAWLASSDIVRNFHDTICKQRLPHTGDWFLKSDIYRKWREASGSFLWLNGSPGCGKTVLTSSIIKETVAYCNRRHRHHLAFFYCSFSDFESQQMDTLIRTIIRQLLLQRSSVPDPVIKIYDKYQKCKQIAVPGDVWKELLRSVIQAQVHTYIIIDGLDECPAYSGERSRIIGMLEALKSFRISKLHVLVTSRKESDIERAMLPLSTVPSLSIQGAEVDKDIHTYLESEIARDKIMSQWPISLQENVAEVLSTKAHGTSNRFRWANCQLQSVRECPTPSTVRETLASLPRSLDETYDRILLNIALEHRAEAINALTWLVFSQRPLSIRELTEATATCLGREEPFNPLDRTLDSESSAALLSGLIVITDGSVRLAHFSVEEYLVSRRLAEGPLSEFYVSLIPSNLKLAAACLRYIQSDFIRVQFASDPWKLDRTPLLRYASIHWPAHLRICQDGLSEQLIQMVINFLQSKDTVSFWERLFFRYEDVEPEIKCLSRGNPRASFQFYQLPGERLIAPSLYYAARFGLLDVAEKLLEPDTDCDCLPDRTTGIATAGKYGDELRVACFFGHENVVRLLIKAGADPEVESARGYTALGISMQAKAPNPQIIEFLLNKTENLSTRDFLAGFILRWAAMEGHFQVSKTLLDKAVDLPAKSDFFWTKVDMDYVDRFPRHIQAQFYVNSLRSYQRDQTAPYETACAGHHKILETLIDKWNNLDECDGEGRTALYWAAFHGHYKVVKLLLERDAKPDAAVNVYGWTAKEWASWNGHRSIESLLDSAPSRKRPKQNLPLRPLLR